MYKRQIVGSREAIEIYNNLINPAVSDKPAKPAAPEKASVTTPQAPAPVEDKKPAETGYKSSERTALENQLLQIETAARAAESEE